MTRPRASPRIRPERDLQHRAAQERRGRERRQADDVDVARLHRLRHAGPLVVHPDVVAHVGQRLHPAGEPHLLLGHRGENRHRRAGLGPQGAERLASGLDRAHVALHRLNQLVLGAAGQRPELDEVRVAGRGTPGTGRHRVDADLVLEQLLVEPADVRVVGHRGGRGQRPERLFPRGVVVRLEPLEQRAEGLPVGVELGALTVELEQSGLVGGELVTRAGKLLATPEGAEPGLRALQEAVVLGELLGQELALPARPLAGPLDVQHLGMQPNGSKSDAFEHVPGPLPAPGEQNRQAQRRAKLQLRRSSGAVLTARARRHREALATPSRGRTSPKRSLPISWARGAGRRAAGCDRRRRA